MADKALNAKKYQKSALISDLLPLGGLIAVVILFGILTKGKIFSSFSLQTIYNQSFLYILGGLGCAFLFAQGAIDLSMGAVIALCSILGAFAANQYGIIACILVCLIVGTICGTITGFIYSHTNIAVFILGLSVCFLIKGTLYQITNGQASISIPYADKKMFTPIWISAVVMVVFALIIYYLFEYHTMGKHSKAIGAGIAAAAQSGVDVTKIKWLGFVISGFTCGMVAFFTMVKTGSGGPATGSNFEFNVMIAMILGGMPSEGGARAKIKSCFIGAILIAFYSNGMVLLGADSRVQEILKGVVFIVVIVGTYRMQMQAEGKKAFQFFGLKLAKKNG
ncbi:MAG: ABC transporter permease [Oscillospiraceae bacterium]|nr:ABC transporter permease [Oscillospiraceae bacterium]